MDHVRLATLALVLLSPAESFAGRPLTLPAPALGEVGLIGLGVAMIGVGAAYLRKR